ncbi:UNVERIFIED_CONTAM: Retrovirus-related Pol polyprotein from transposon RE2 [Sesamum radiatum]|uniref:Retrovirus-related Pol polyprotein from transposon RE2 n=1 Tax=Sesamum radiatum TaxID=300843 RepID=A0AAW2KQ20_SESRA
MVNTQTGDSAENVALQTKWLDNRGNNGPRNGSQNLNRGGFRGKIMTDKRSQVCGNCGRTGHTKDTCFKLHGVPDWYKELKDQKRREGGLARGFNVISGEGGTSTDGSNNIGEAMKQMTELIKLMKENIPPQDPLQVNFAHGDDFASKATLINSSVNVFGSWIIDTDNGSEFVNANCHDLFQSLGILHQRSCPHTPQQNGVVERKHQHLLNIARALLHQASLPRFFWGECILTAAYLVNRLPSSALQWKTPYEILYQKLPSLDHLKGCQFHESQFPFEQISPTPTSYLPAPVTDITSYPSPSPASVDSTTSSSVSPVPEYSSLTPPSAHVPTLRRSQRQVNVIHEPRTFAEANKHPQWRAAMDKELEALENKSTWDLTTLPAGKRAIGSRWVYKVKLHQDGSIERYKARLVAKGYTQVEGVDFFDSFSPVAKTVTVRLFIAIASAYRWPLLQLDVNNAFLHGHLDEEVYIVPPEGYDKAHGGLVCRLKRSLYGLKQASWQWNIELTSKLESYGFTQSPHDHCLFTLRKDSLFLALIVYVDDVLLTGNSLDDLNAVKSYLDDLFTIKDLGNAKYFLGLELARSTQGTYLSQFIQHPRQPYWDAALHLVRYLKGTPTLGLFFASTSSLKLTAYSDSDWASCLDTRRSVSGYCVFLGDSLVSWKPRNKPPSLAPLPRQNTEAWVLLFVNYFGSVTFLVNLAFSWLPLFHSIVTTKLLSISLRIRFSMSEQSILILTATLFVISSSTDSSFLNTFPVSIRLVSAFHMSISKRRHDGGWRCGILMTNMSECINGVLRGLAPAADEYTVTKYNHSQQSASVVTRHQNRHGSTPILSKLLIENDHAASGINLASLVLTLKICGAYNISVESMVKDYYDLMAYKNTYSKHFEPVQSKDYWDEPDF